MEFTSRQHAGQLLGRRLVEQELQADLVLGLPRGGIIVAAEVAQALTLPLDAILVRKIGHPNHREFAVGAMSENGVILYDPSAPTDNPALQDVVAEEARRLISYRRVLDMGKRPALRGLRLVLVDDGLATGATMDAAVRSARFQKARHITVAVPVASTDSVTRLSEQADDVIALVDDPAFEAVGLYYQAFEEVSDQDVLRLLAQGRKSAG